MVLRQRAWLPTWIGCAMLCAGLVLHAGPAPQGGNSQKPGPLAPYADTPQNVVEKMLEMAGVTSAVGVESLVTFMRQDLMTVDLSGASVVTLYLLEDSNVKIRRKLTTELKAGSRIVSHAFSMGDWKPDRIARIESGFLRFVFLWVADGRIR